MNKRIIIASILMITACGTGVHAADALVDAGWIKANIGKPGVVFVDLRNAKAYKDRHVPGAVHTSYKKDGWRVNKAPVKGLMPEPAKLEKLIGSLGIDNNSHVILLSPGEKAGDLAASARLYWTFKVVGHDEVSILNGGMKAYLKDKSNPTKSGVEKPEARVFAARPRKELLATEDDVRRALKARIALIDSRTSDQHLGINTSRSKVKRAGTIPGAKSVPAVWLTREGGGTFRDAATIERLYAHSGTPASGKTITFCNTGHVAALGWFVNYEILGNRQTKLYDGSMSQWSQTDSNPMEQRVKLD